MTVKCALNLVSFCVNQFNRLPINGRCDAIEKMGSFAQTYALSVLSERN